MAKKKEKTLEEKLQEALVPENQWPYMLPENWCWTYVEFIADKIKRGKSPKYVEKSLFPVFAQKCNQKDGTIALEKARFLNPDMASKISDDVFLREDDIVINSTGTGTLGRVGFIRKKDMLGYKQILPDSHVTTVRGMFCVNKSYLYMFLKMKQAYLELQGSGSTNQKELRPDSIGTIEFPLPPLLEQKHIVHRIESLFAKLDEAKEKIQQVLDGAEMRKAAILHKAFTGELTKNWRKENGINEDSWEVKKLSDCGNWYGGGTPSKTHPEYWEKGNILWITSKDMKSDYIEDSQQHINSYGVENSSAKYIEEHALICVMRSGILRHSFPVAVIKKPFTVNQDLKVLVPNKMINIEYLLYICKYKEQSILNSCMKNGTTVESINFDKLKNFSIMIPAEIEQIRIVNIIKKFLCRENDVLNKCNKFITSIDTMKKSILAKAFRGELGTNNPIEDSALNILKEVLQDKF